MNGALPPWPPEGQAVTVLLAGVVDYRSTAVTPDGHVVNVAAVRIAGQPDLLVYVPVEAALFLAGDKRALIASAANDGRILMDPGAEVVGCEDCAVAGSGRCPQHEQQHRLAERYRELQREITGVDEVPYTT